MLPLIPLLALSGDAKLSRLAAENVAAFRKAILRKDAAWFERTFSPSFVQRTEGRPMSRKAALDQIRKGLLKMRLSSLETRIVQVRPATKGFVATVSLTGTAHGLVQGLPATLTAKWTDDQTWTPVGAAWKLQSLSTRGFQQSVSLDQK